MSLRTYIVTWEGRTTRTISIEIDDNLYRNAIVGNRKARDRICIIVKQRLGLSRYVAWGSFRITLDQPPLVSGACDDCAMCDLGNHHQCRKCTL